MKQHAATLVIILMCLSTTGWAGNIDSPAVPDNAASAMYTIEDIYNRLNSGAVGIKRTSPFQQPGAGPGSTMRTLDQVMGIAPTLDNANGATTANVASGKTFWGLTGGQWGFRTGTAYPAPTAKTGQTTSYVTRDDGDLERGVAWPNPRFTDNGNGTVTDNLTGLIWLKNANPFSTENWGAALDSCAILANGNYGLTDGSVAGDWRLPNVQELQSLIDYQFFSPALSNTAGTAQWTAGNPFTGVQSADYWSSSTFISGSTNAWVVSFNGGFLYANDKTGNYYLWPMRGGQ